MLVASSPEADAGHVRGPRVPILTKASLLPLWLHQLTQPICIRPKPNSLQLNQYGIWRREPEVRFASFGKQALT